MIIPSITKDTYDSIDSIRNFIVKCGDLVNPCPLDINFNYGDRATYQSDIHFTTKLLNKLKNKMVKEKNDVIFGYILPNIATERFNELSEELKERVPTGISPANRDSVSIVTANVLGIITYLI